MSKQFINPEGLSKPTGYTHIVDSRGSRIIHISGQVAFNKDGQIVGVGDMQAQAEQVFQNLQVALAAVGANFSDVVKLSYFVTDVSKMPVVREVRNRYLDSSQLPASTAVEVKGLVLKDLLIEVEAVAILE